MIKAKLWMGTIHIYTVAVLSLSFSWPNWSDQIGCLRSPLVHLDGVGLCGSPNLLLPTAETIRNQRDPFSDIKGDNE